MQWYQDLCGGSLRNLCTIIQYTEVGVGRIGAEFGVRICSGFKVGRSTKGSRGRGEYHEPLISMSAKLDQAIGQSPIRIYTSGVSLGSTGLGLV